MRSPACVIASLFLLLCAATAAAQVLPLPPRPYRGLFGGGPPPDPNRMRQELTMSGDLLGGYDDNLAPPNSGAVGQSYPSGYTAFSDALLRYSLGKLDRFIAASGRGYMTTYRNIGIGPSYGGEQMLQARTGAGKRAELQVEEAINYAPYFSLGLFTPAQGPGTSQANPDANPTNGLTKTGSWSTHASAAFNYNWTRTTRTDLSYGFNRISYPDALAFDTRTHSAGAALERNVSRTFIMRGGYHANDTEYAEPDGQKIPLRDHTAEGGFRWTKRVSRTRTLSVGGGAGAVFASAIDRTTRADLSFTAPSGYANARLDIARSWNISGDYRRSVSAPQGASPDPYVTDAALISAGGYVSRWLESVVSLGYSNGATNGSLDGKEEGRYEAYTGTVQLRFRLSRFWSTVISGSHYQYQLNGAAAESLRVAPRMDRNSIRIGIAWQLPLYGAYVDAPGQGGRD